MIDKLPNAHDKNTFRNLAAPLLTPHARRRMRQRGLSPAAIDAALAYGRCAHVRGADVFAIGRRDIQYFARQGVDLSPFEGVHVVCGIDGWIFTAYRNRNLSGLRY